MHVNLDEQALRTALLTLYLAFTNGIESDLAGATTGTDMFAGLDFHYAQTVNVMGRCHLEASDSLGMVNVAGLHPESLLVTCFRSTNNIRPMQTSFDCFRR